jgi:peptide deformylase
MRPTDFVDVATLHPIQVDLNDITQPLPRIVHAGDPVLREVAQAVPQKEIASAEMQKLVRTMVEVMRRAPGVGLAAPQIGIGLRVIVVEDVSREVPVAQDGKTPNDPRQREGLPLLAVFNPEIERVKGVKKVTHYEGCLSVPGYSAEVARDLEVRVTGLGLDGQPLRLVARGWAARIFQHELDHLKGTLYVDKMNPRSLCCDGA